MGKRKKIKELLNHFKVTKHMMLGKRVYVMDANGHCHFVGDEMARLVLSLKDCGKKHKRHISNKSLDDSNGNNPNEDLDDSNSSDDSNDSSCSDLDSELQSDSFNVTWDEIGLDKIVVITNIGIGII